MNFFKRDILVLLLVSILLGTILAKGVSYGANIYFQQTLSSLVGDYGEYDLLMQIREDNKAEGVAQLAQLLEESFAGASYKEGPAIIGKANIFIALPAEKKNQAVYENLDRLFSSIPGISGVSVLTEPRLNVRGVPPGAAAMLEEEFKAIDGVAFVYRSGGSIGIVLDGINEIALVTNQVEAALTRNKIIDVGFPAGVEPENPVLTAEVITGEIYRQLTPQTVQYVSVDTGDDDMVHLVSTMQELRRFLLGYMTAVRVTPRQKGTLAPGDKLAFQGGEARAPQAGEAVKRGNIIVLLTEANKDGSLNGVITQGDAAAFQSKDGYSVVKEQIGTAEGRAAIENPRQAITAALTASADLMEKLPALVREGDLLSEKIFTTLSDYTENTAAMQSTLDQMDSAALTMRSATEKLENANVQGVRAQLDQSAKSMNGLLNALRLVRMFNPDVTNAMDSLQHTQEKLQGFSTLLAGMERVTGEAAQARDILVGLSESGKSVAGALEDFSGSKARLDLQALRRQFGALAKTDFQSFANELRRLADQAPQLSDESIYRSVQLMDKVIEGQIIPGKRLQIMVDRQLSTEQVKPIVYAALGHESASVYETDLGAIEPNIYLQVYQVFKEVQAVLAGFTSLVFMVVYLALDHTAVMSVLRAERRRKTVRQTPHTLLNRLQTAVAALFYAENLYGMVVGAILLSALFFLSGGGIPYVSWYAIPLLGLLIGFGMARLTEKITPLSADEILAGQSLGLSFDEIMREIVIPNARPGILQRLNRRKQKFK